MTITLVAYDGSENAVRAIDEMLDMIEQVSCMCICST